MKSVIITNIDDETHKYLRLHCFRQGLSMVHIIREEIGRIAEHEKVLQGVKGESPTEGKEMTCKRCDHHWTSTLPSGLPRRCPRCHSPYWDRPRRSRPIEKITPMIIQRDGKTYSVEYFCSTCEVSWPRDTETLNVSCPRCRRKCGATSRQVEISAEDAQGLAVAEEEEPMSFEEFQRQEEKKDAVS